MNENVYFDIDKDLEYTKIEKIIEKYIHILNGTSQKIFDLHNLTRACLQCIKESKLFLNFKAERCHDYDLDKNATYWYIKYFSAKIYYPFAPKVSAPFAYRNDYLYVYDPVIVQALNHMGREINSIIVLRSNLKAINDFLLRIDACIATLRAAAANDDDNLYDKLECIINMKNLKDKIIKYVEGEV